MFAWLSKWEIPSSCYWQPYTGPLSFYNQLWKQASLSGWSQSPDQNPSSNQAQNLVPDLLPALYKTFNTCEVHGACIFFAGLFHSAVFTSGSCPAQMLRSFSCPKFIITQSSTCPGSASSAPVPQLSACLIPMPKVGLNSLIWLGPNSTALLDSFSPCCELGILHFSEPSHCHISRHAGLPRKEPL